jgi:hypothetical protein
LCVAATYFHKLEAANASLAVANICARLAGAKRPNQETTMVFC